MKQHLWFGAYLIVVIGLGGYALLRPIYNWDGIAYIAAVLSWTNSDLSQVQQQTYQAIQQAVPEATFRELMRPGYRAAVATDINVLADQLPFYTARPIYLSMIFGLAMLGIPIVMAVQLCSVLPVIGLGIVVFFWLREVTHAGAAAILALLLLLGAGSMEVARLATPDALAALFVVTALFAAIARGHPFIGGLLLLLSIGVRPDTVISVCLLLPLFVVGPSPRTISLRAGGALAFGAALLYLLIQTVFPDYSYSTVFYHTFVQPLTDPNKAPALTASLYSRILRTRILNEWLILPMPFFFGTCACLTLLVQPIQRSWSSQYGRLTILIVAALLVRLVLFPALWPRFFVAHYLLLGIALMCTLLARQHPVVSKLQTYSTTPSSSRR